MHIFASRISKSNRISNSSKQDIMMNKTAVIAMAALISSSAALAKDIKMIAIKTSPVVKTVEKGEEIKNALRVLPGVKKVEPVTVDLTVNVKYDADKTSKAEILKAMSKMGYKTYVVSDEKKGEKPKVDATSGATKQKGKKK